MFKMRASLESIIKPLNQIKEDLRRFDENARLDIRDNDEKISELMSKNKEISAEMQQATTIMENLTKLGV